MNKTNVEEIKGDGPRIYLVLIYNIVFIAIGICTVEKISDD